MARDPSTELSIVRPARRRRDPKEFGFGFTLSFISGLGLLTSRDKQIGPFDLKVLELEIPDIEFPFDVTGGSERFKTKRCRLRHLAISIDSDGLSDALAGPNVQAGGFQELKSAVRDGYVQLAGRFRIGEHHADFTMRGALLIHSPRELSIVFYDTRLYGWLPFPAALLPAYLERAIEIPYVSATKAGSWTLTPVDDFLRAILPRAGWKVPDTRQAGLAVADVARGRITLGAGGSDDPTERQRVERAPPTEALIAGEGIALFATAEESLARGDFQDAYQRFREALDDDRASRFAQDRLLQIGASDPDLALETRQLAEEALADDPHHVQALLALGAISLRERAWGEASTRYARLAEVARASNLRYDIIAAELAEAGAAAPIDPAAALASYERAAARARDSVIAHEALFDIRRANQDWDGAAKAGDRLAKLLQGNARQAAVHRQLGVMHRVHRGDLKKARLHFERALKIEPDDPDALEGLAETYAARGEPARAASYLSRLAEHAESTEDTQRIVSLNLRLGEIWERWLGDEENASNRYRRVLDVDRRNRVARLRLAAIAEKHERWDQARQLYEDLLAIEEERGDPDATSDLVQAYTRLARVTLDTDGATPEAVACLERAVELDPSNRPAREQLAKVMRELGQWSRLAQLLDSAARHSTNFAEARRARLDAARLEISHSGDLNTAHRHLSAILDERPDDVESLDLFVPLLEKLGETGELVTRLEQAAEVTLEPVRRADYLLRLANVREGLGVEPESVRRALESALDANPYLRGAAERLVDMLADNRDYERLVRALGRLATATLDTKVRADGLIRRGTLLWQQLERFEAAEESYRRALLLSPSDFAAWNQLSRLLEGTGKFDQAVASLETALAEANRRGANAGPLHERMAEIARAMHDPEKEVAALGRAFEAGMRSDALAERLIHVLSDLGRGRDAAELLEEWASAGDREDDDVLLFQAAELRRSLGEQERAAHVYSLIVDRGGAAAPQAAQALERLAVDRGDADAERKALEFQLTRAEGAARLAVLERYVEALVRYGEFKAMEGAAREILELEPRSAIAHRRLAQYMESIENFNEALFHYEKFIFEVKRDGVDRDARRDAFVQAAGLAHEISPNFIPRLQEAFDFEFPEAVPDALDRPLGELLAEQERWEELLRLRETQLDNAEGRSRFDLEFEVAELYNQRLGRYEEAIPHYQAVAAGSEEPGRSRDALTKIYEELERWGDLANHLFAMSQLSADRDDALRFGLRAVEVYDGRVDDERTATQTLRTLLVDPEEDWRYPELISALWAHELHSELALLLEKSLEHQPDPDDGRLEQFVGLLTSQLGEAERAATWTELMIDSYPDSDVPRKLHVDVLRRFPEIGDDREWLKGWADDREGEQRARILVALADAHRNAGDGDGELVALEEAANLDPKLVDVVELIVERHTARGEWNETVVWLEKLADTVDPGEERDTRLRRVVEIASDYLDDASIAIRALSQIFSPTDEERRHLAELHVETGALEGLRANADEIEALGGDALLRSAELAFAGEDLELSTRFFEGAMRQGMAEQGWSRAAELWRDVGLVAELARWRLRFADEADESLASLLRLEAHAELLESGDDREEGAARSSLEAANLHVACEALAAHRIARALGDEGGVERTGEALLALLGDDDERVVPVLLARTERALERSAPDEAAALAHRLVGMGHPSGASLLVLALETAGRTDELVEVLRDRAKAAAPEEAAPLWLRIAQLLADENEHGRAIDALDEISPDLREQAWGELLVAASTVLGDMGQRVRGALVCAEHADDAEGRAQWLTYAGRLSWWELDDEIDGREYLGEALSLVPRTVHEWIDEIREAEGEERERRLAEAFALVAEEQARPLWLERFALECGRNLVEPASRALEAAAQLTGEHEPDAWIEIADLAAQLSHRDLERRALQSAYAAERAHEGRLVACLESEGLYGDACDTLEARARELEGVEARERWEHAARIARDSLADSDRALRDFQNAVAADATRENLELAFLAADALGRVETVCDLGKPLLAAVDSDDPARAELLRTFADALVEEDRIDDLAEALDELVGLEVASPEDHRRLAALVEEADPARAAELLEVALLGAADGSADDYRDVAARWLALDARERALPLLEEALARGADDLETHQIAISLLVDDARLESLRRVIDLGGDIEWPIEKRLSARLELAEWMLDRNEGERARALLDEGREWGTPALWITLMERALKSEGNTSRLVNFHLEILSGEQDAWGPDEARGRLLEAVEHYHILADSAGEYRALDLLVRNDPDNPELQERLMSVMARLGDRDSFAGRVDAQWESAPTTQRPDIALRYAPVFEERFDDADFAEELLARAYALEPSPRVFDAVWELALRRGRERELWNFLREGLEGQEPEARRALDLRLAAVARDSLNDDDLAAQILSRVFFDDPTVAIARDFMLEYWERHESYAELVDALERVASSAEQDQDAKAHLLRAVELIDVHLDQDDRAVALLAEALTRDEADRKLTYRLVVRYLDRNELDSALTMVTEQRVEAEQDLAVLERLAAALSSAHRDEERAHTRALIAERHPDSAAAGLYRLELARKENDPAAIAEEAGRRLREVPNLPGLEWVALHVEAGDAALEINDRHTALSHYIASVDTTDPSPQALRKACELAIDLGEDSRLQYLIGVAAMIRELITTEAIRAKGQDKVGWFTLLGQAHQGAADSEAAVDAFRQAFELSESAFPTRAFRALAYLYENDGEWQELVSLYREKIERVDEAAEKAEAYCQIARIQQDELGDAAAAEEAFAKALELDDGLSGAKTTLGMMLLRRREFGRALELLEGVVAIHDPETKLEILGLYFEALWAGERNQEAVEVADVILERDGSRTEILAEKARLLEQLGDLDGAEASWASYLDALGPDAEHDEQITVLRKLVAGAERREERSEAAKFLERILELDGNDLATVTKLRAHLVDAGEIERAAHLYEREADLSDDPRMAADALAQACGLYRSQANNTEALRVLTRAESLAADGTPLLHEILELASLVGDEQRYFEVAERLVDLSGLAEIGDEVIERLASRADAQGDSGRAVDFYGELHRRHPDNLELEDMLRKLALSTENFERYAELEELSINRLADDEERAVRLRELASIYIQKLRDSARAAQIISVALKIAPNDRGLRRRLADTYAMKAESYAQANEIYRELLQDDPFNVNLLRIIARLYGQTGDTDRAFGHYAALAVLLPGDEEAKRFVDACRQAMPPAPPRPVTDTDRGRGMVHPDQLGPIEELFAPLARFAELTHPGDLRARGVEERDRLNPTDPDTQWFNKVLESLGVPEANLYLWRGGGFACQAELVGSATILLGSSLMSDASQRQRAFILARTAELYRTGHVLCERLSSAGLEAMTAAIGQAVVADAAIPGATAQSQEWAQVIANPMTPQIRQQLAPRVQQYASRFGEVDIGKWRRASLSTAARTALVLTCDVSDAISAMLRLRGFDDISDDQRPAVIRESDEELDLWHFALSESYYKLRASLGIALQSG